jgi:hypothetical protein
MRSSKQTSERPRWFAQTLREVGAFFQVHVDTVGKWKATWMPAKESRGYNLSEIAKVRHQRLLESPQVAGVMQGGDEPNDLREARLENVREDTRGKKIANDSQQNELLPRAEVERALVNWSVRHRTPLLALADTFALRAPGNQKAEVKAWAKSEIVAALTRVRDMNITGTRLEDLILAEADRIRDERDAMQKSKKRRTARKKAMRTVTTS